MKRTVKSRLMSLALFAGLSLGTWSMGEAALTRVQLVNLPIQLARVEATASSVLGDFSAGKAIDGLPQIRWDSGVVASSANPQWIKVDLGGIHEIARINLLGPTPGQKKFYSVSVSVDDETWTRVLPRGKPAPGLDGVTGGEAVRVSRKEPIAAQYVKYEVFGGTGRQTARLGELRVIGNPSAQQKEVPIPAAFWLMGSGLVCLAGLRRTRKQAGPA